MLKGRGSEVFGQVGEDLVAVIGHEDVVFDADPAYAGEVDAGFDGDDVSGLEDALGFGGESWFFVDFESDAVAGGVEELFGEAGFADDFAGGGIDLGEGDAWGDGVDGGELGVEDDLVDVGDLACHLAEGDDAGHIRAVAVDSGPPVKKDATALFELAG